MTTLSCIAHPDGGSFPATLGLSFHTHHAPRATLLHRLCPCGSALADDAQAQVGERPTITVEYTGEDDPQMGLENGGLYGAHAFTTGDLKVWPTGRKPFIVGDDRRFSVVPNPAIVL